MKLVAGLIGGVVLAAAGGAVASPAPRGEISGRLAYADFQLPTDLEQSQKRLGFKALGYRCRPP